MTPAVLHVLLSLADGERHGYGIKLDVEERTDGAIRLGPGTLYEAIHRLEKSGWIEETNHDERRKFYRLTRAGRRHLEKELNRLNEIIRFARSKALLR
ncbi:MAG TPA: helix-turn-helix transcriptional regulator [Vicinamibacteria bacterium]|nr:helix-turn-helix transcriptional regulator [Vicinamibacteria bacterium]